LADLRSFGFRAPSTFGVSGLLSETSQVMHQPVSGPESLGRISDFVAVKMRSLRVNELGLRLALLRAGFFAFSQFSDRKCVGLEIGADSERVAIGFNFVAKKGLSFDQIRHQLGELAGSVIVRWQPSTRRAEIVVLLGLQSPVSVCELITLGDQVESTPAPARYMSLADLSELRQPWFQTRGAWIQRIIAAFKRWFAKPGELVPFDTRILTSPVQTPASTSQAATAAKAPVAPDPVPAPVESLTYENVSKSLQEFSVVVQSDAEQSLNDLAPIRSTVKEGTAREAFDDWSKKAAEERVRLKNTAREMAAFLALREEELRKKEEAFTQTLREREEELRQRTVVAEKAEEVAARANAELERLREKALNKEDTATLKVRFVQMAKELHSAKQLNLNLATKIEELKGLVQQTRTRVATEGSELKTRAELEELRRKIAQSVKIMTNQKRDMERINALLEESRKQESALKGELNRLKKKAA